MDSSKTQLTPSKREQLLRMAKSLKLKTKDMALPKITKEERGERVGLSFTQQRLWFLAQMAAASQAYHLAFGARLRGELNKEALRGALDGLVARHEALR